MQRDNNYSTARLLEISPHRSKFFELDPNFAGTILNSTDEQGLE